MTKIKIFVKILFIILAIALTFSAAYEFYKYQSNIFSGVASCGGQGGAGGNVQLTAGTIIQGNNSSINAGGGKGGDCNIYLQNQGKFELYSFISLIGLIVGIFADSIVVYHNVFGKKSV